MNKDKNKKAINLKDYNYPPFINIIHYSLDELNDYKRVIIILFIVDSKINSFIICYYIFYINFKYNMLNYLNCKWI